MDSKYKQTEYAKEMGTIRWQDSFIDQLRGRTIEEQLHCYGWCKDHPLLNAIPFSEAEAYIRRERLEQDVSPVTNDKLIIKDGLVAGVDLSWSIPSICQNHKEYVLPYGSCVYASALDNNGAGYKERKWYKYLICLPFDHTLWD